MTPTRNIENEIDKAFEEAELESMTVAELLSQLELKEIENRLEDNYNYANGGRKPKYTPISMAKLLLYKKLKGINYNSKVLRNLQEELKDAVKLGFSVNAIPQSQNLSNFLRKRLDDKAEELIEYTANYVRDKCKQKNKLKDIDPVIKNKSDSNSESKSSKEVVIDKKFHKVSNFLKWRVFPAINFLRDDNNKYDDIEILDLLTFTAMRNVCTNEGYNLLSDFIEKDIPTPQNVLHHIRKLEKQKIYGMFDQANKRILDLAKEKGRLDRPVDVAIDFTNVMYYGDKNDEMVKEVKPKNGTSHAYQFATIKIVSGGELYTLKAIPVHKLSDKKEVVERLLEATQEYVEIRRVYADRGFFTGEIINLFKEKNLKFLMPAVRNSKVKSLLEEEGAPSFTPYVMKGKEEAKFNLVIREGEEGDPKPFATNCNRLEVLTNDLFELYGRRWDIETGYRVQKNNFYPKTTSKNYNVRLFYFLFSQLVYNSWILTNIAINLNLHNEIKKEKVITAQEFITKLFKAYVDYG